MVAFPPPPVTIRQRSSTFVELLCSLRRVLASGCHSFLFEWLEKVSQPSLAEPFGSDVGVNRINSRLFLLSLECHHSIAVPLSVSKAATFVTGALYSGASFRSIFSVFYFSSFSAALIFLRTASISSSLLYFVRGQKNPFNPSFFRRGTMCTCKCGTL